MNKSNELKSILASIAYECDLQFVETTDAVNGYPQHIEYAIRGFETYEQLEQVVEKYKDTISLNDVLLDRRDGWQLWHRSYYAPNGFEFNAEEFLGNNYIEYEKMTEEEFVKSEIIDLYLLDDCESFFDIENRISCARELWNAIDSMSDDEVAVTCNGYYYDTYQKRSMDFYHDTKHLSIGLTASEDDIVEPEEPEDAD